MRLKISQLINLQDARYSAAVGFDMVGFSLERGSHHKLSASMIWNMVQWLTGPEVVLELNAASLEELESIEEVFDYQWITFPIDEWNELVLAHSEAAVLLRANTQTDPGLLMDVIRQVRDEERRIQVELEVERSADLDAFEPILSDCYLHFRTLDGLEAYLQAPGHPVAGISMGLEAEEEPGVLHYERLDDIVGRVLELRELQG